MGQRVAGFERSTFGRAHPRMVSWSETVPPNDYLFLLRSPALDVASTHPYELYGSEIRSGAAMRTSVVQSAVDVHQRIKQLLGTNLIDRRPWMENERHMNDSTPSTFHRETEHDMSWAELSSGAAGTGITWLIIRDQAGSSQHLAERHQVWGPGRRALRDFVARRVPAEYLLSQTIDEALDNVTTRGRCVPRQKLGASRRPQSTGERCVEATRGGTLLECVPVRCLVPPHESSFSFT